MLDASFPGVETPGYHRISLREKQPLRFGEERHLMVARPFRAGLECIRCDLINLTYCVSCPDCIDNSESAFPCFKNATQRCKAFKCVFPDKFIFPNRPRSDRL